MFSSPTTLSPSPQGFPVHAFASSPLDTQLFSSRPSTLHVPPLSPFPAALTGCPQLHENSAALSPAFAILTECVKHKSSVCHSYKKHGGWGYPRQNEFQSFMRVTNSNSGKRDALPAFGFLHRLLRRLEAIARTTQGPSARYE